MFAFIAMFMRSSITKAVAYKNRHIVGGVQRSTSRLSAGRMCKVVVVKYTSIYISLYHDSSLKRLGMARVNEGSHSFTCHPHVYPQVEWTIPAFTPQLHSITALWLVLISCPAEGRRLSWPGWLGEILRWFARRRQVTRPSTNRARRT